MTCCLFSKCSFAGPTSRAATWFRVHLRWALPSGAAAVLVQRSLIGGSRARLLLLLLFSRNKQYDFSSDSLAAFELRVVEAEQMGARALTLTTRSITSKTHDRTLGT